MIALIVTIGLTFLAFIFAACKAASRANEAEENSMSRWTEDEDG